MILHAYKSGFSQVARAKRLVILTWVLSVALSLLAALPMLDTLEGYVGPTTMEEELVDQMSANWFATFQADHQTSELVKHLDLTIFGHALFYHHAELYLTGAIVKGIGSFFIDLLLRFRFSPEHVSLLLLITVLYGIVWIFFAGGFIGVYARNQQGALSEFLSEGVRYFGPFLRLSLFSILIYFLLFSVVIDPITNLIAPWTERESSELTPFILYMMRNLAVAALLALLTMGTDYAKIRIVVDDRSSALLAFFAGLWFGLRQFPRTGGLYVLLSFTGFVLIGLYAVVESQIPQTGYFSILVIFLFQQIYMVMRLTLKAGFYAAQTSIYSTIIRREHTASTPMP